jgi:hypothetical protein
LTRAALVRLQGVAEPAVVVLVAAQGIGDPGGRLAEEAGGEQAPFEQPRLVQQEAVCRRERVIHAPTIR